MTFWLLRCCIFNNFSLTIHFEDMEISRTTVENSRKERNRKCLFRNQPMGPWGMGMSSLSCQWLVEFSLMGCQISSVDAYLLQDCLDTKWGQSAITRSSRHSRILREGTWDDVSWKFLRNRHAHVNPCELKVVSEQEFRAFRDFTNTFYQTFDYTIMYKTHTKRALPYPAQMLTHRADWKESLYHMLFENTLLSNFC